MGFSLVAAAAVIGVSVFLVIEILSGSIFTTISEFNDSYDELKDRLLDQGETDINITNVADVGWWDTDWNYRKMIIIDHSKVADDLTNFPVLIDIIDNELKAKTQLDGDDILFVSGDNTTKYNHEIESYQAVGENGHLVAWVNVTNVSADVDTWFFMYYNNSDCDSQENAAGVWDANYTMIHHLENDPSGKPWMTYDSTSNNNDGAVSGAILNYTGKINSAYDFDGVNNHITVPDTGTSLDFNAGENYTWSAWIYPAEVADHGGYMTGGFFHKGLAGFSGNGYSILLYPPGACHRLTINDNVIILSSSGTNKCVPLNQWSYITVTYANKRVSLYLDGELDKTSTISGFSSNLTGLVYLGYATEEIGRDSYFNGTLDEIQFSNISRNAAWINASYNTMNSPSTFFRVEPEQSQSYTYLNITVENTGNTNLKTNDFTLLVNGEEISFVYLQPYLYPEKQTDLLVNVSASGTKRNKLITENGKADYEDYNFS